MLIKGKSQNQICKVLQKDKGQISRIVNRLVSGGYLVCKNPQSRDKIYIATKKPFNAKEVYKLPSSKSQRIHGRCEIIQIQKSSFLTHVKSPPKVNVKWDKEWDINGLHYQQYAFPFPSVGDVKFQRIIGKNSDKVKIILPRMIWDRSEGTPEPFLREVADRAGTWFMHHFKIELVGLSVCQSPDYALMLTDSRLIDLSRKGTFHNDKVMLDCSKPDELPELESKDFDLIDGLSQAPVRIARLEKEVSEIKHIVVDLSGSVKELVGLFKFSPVRDDGFEDVV
jgi:hypothetical protein